MTNNADKQISRVVYQTPDNLLFRAALAAQELCEAKTWLNELLFWGIILVGVIAASSTLSDQVEPANAPYLLGAALLMLVFALASGVYSAWHRARMVQKSPGAALLLGAKTDEDAAGLVARSVSRLVFMTPKDRKIASFFEGLTFFIPLLAFMLAMPILLFLPFGDTDFREYILLLSLVPSYFFLFTVVRALSWRAIWTPRLARRAGASLEEIMRDFGFVPGRFSSWASTNRPVEYRLHMPAAIEDEDDEVDLAGDAEPPNEPF